MTATAPATAQGSPEATDLAHNEASERIQAFGRAYARWLRSLVQLEVPDSEDKQFVLGTFLEERAALRELFLVAADCSETIWAKLAAFEVDLVREKTIGDPKDSIVLLGLGAIKNDLMNMGIRHNGPEYRIIMTPRYTTQAEADCAALGLNHTAREPMNALTDRRSLLRGALTVGAAASVGGIPAAAGASETPDPIFDLLEVHRSAWARFNEIDYSDHEACEAGAGAAEAAFDALKETPPTTKAGMPALPEHLDEWTGESGHFYDYGLLLRSPVLAG